VQENLEFEKEENDDKKKKIIVLKVKTNYIATLV